MANIMGAKDIRKATGERIDCRRQGQAQAGRRGTQWALAALLLGFAAAHPTAAVIGLTDGSLLQGRLTGAMNGDCIVTRPSGSTVTLRCAEIASLQAADDVARPTSAAPAGQTLHIAGSNTIGSRLMPALIAEFARSRGAGDANAKTLGPDHLLLEFAASGMLPWRQVDISSHGTASGFKGLNAPEAEAASEVAASPIPTPPAGATAAAASPREEPGKPPASMAEERIMRTSAAISELWRELDSSTTADNAKTPPAPAAAPMPAAGSAPAPRRKRADLAMASRRIHAQEIHALRDLGALDHPSNEHVIAMDGLAVIVHRENRIDHLSIEDIRKVFSGAINDWSEIGGPPGPVLRYARTDGSGTMDTFASLVLNGSPLARDSKRIEDSAELAAEVARHPGAIGFVGMPYVGASKALGIRECGLSYQPTSFNTKTEEYPLSRRLYLYAPAKRASGVQDFLNFTSMPAAQRVVESHGFVGLSVETDSVGEQRRLRIPLSGDAAIRRHDDASYSHLLRSAQRLSVTVRFRTAAADLDTRSLRDIERIHAFVKEQSERRPRITLVGFTDAIGSPEANKALSLSRAQSVAVMLKGLPVTRVLGFGPEYPVACNATDEGRGKNRRVEIWIEG